MAQKKTNSSPVNNRFNRRYNIQPPKKLFVIATEGEKTEGIYFQSFTPSSYSIKTELLLTEKGKSSPKHVLKRILKYIKDKKNGDEFWVVIDRDKWTNNELQSVYAEATRQNISVALSNPCFELWLLLHYVMNPTPQSAADCKKLLKKHIPTYKKNKYPTDDLHNKRKVAVANAERLDSPPTNSWPRNTGSTVYKLVKKLGEFKDKK